MVRRDRRRHVSFVPTGLKWPSRCPHPQRSIAGLFSTVPAGTIDADRQIDQLVYGHFGLTVAPSFNPEPQATVVWYGTLAYRYPWSRTTVACGSGLNVVASSTPAVQRRRRSPSHKN